MKKNYLFAIVALVLSHAMCTVVAYNYRDMLCSIEHQGFSAPATLALLPAVPFAVGIAVCVMLAVRFSKKK